MSVIQDYITINDPANSFPKLDGQRQYITVTTNLYYGPPLSTQAGYTNGVTEDILRNILITTNEVGMVPIDTNMTPVLEPVSLTK